MPATINIEMPAVTTVAKATPTKPPILTSPLLRPLLAMSTPAAPAVAKNPTTNVSMKASTPKLPSAVGALGAALALMAMNTCESKLPTPPIVFASSSSKMASGISGR